MHAPAQRWSPIRPVARFNGAQPELAGFDADAAPLPVTIRQVQERPANSQTEKLVVRCWACIEDDNMKQSVCIGITCPDTIG